MKYYYLLILLIFCLSSSIIFFSNNYLKKLIGVCILQSSVVMFYVGFGKFKNSITPIITSSISESEIYTSPIPSVLMLTAIVVGFACFCVGLSMLIRISSLFKTLDVKKIDEYIKKHELLELEYDR
jgi:multicomponent Na+:H+ antiporter subunit C